MRDQFRNGDAHPIYFGSAITGMGVSQLLSGVTKWFPVNHPSDEATLSGMVFKLEKEPTGEKIAYVKLFAGQMRMRESVLLQRENKDGNCESLTCKVKKLHMFIHGKSVIADEVHSGDLGKVWGLTDVRIGDIVGERSRQMMQVHFAEPHMETRVEATNASKPYELYQALLSLADEDPLIEVVKDDVQQDLHIRIFGEVQKEVIGATLKERYGIDVQFSETRVICIEKPRGSGCALDVMGGTGNPFCATVGLRVEPGAPESGVVYRLAVELGSLPLAFHHAIEDTVHDTLKQGLYGWEVTDIVVTLTHTEYASPVTIAGDFRKLVPLVLLSALNQAGTDVYEPIERFELTIPANMMSKAVFILSGINAAVHESVIHKDTCLVRGTLAVAATDRFRRILHFFTKGEGVMVAQPCGFAKVHADAPTRSRTDHNPLNRSEYLLYVKNAK